MIGSRLRGLYLTSVGPKNPPSTASESQHMFIKRPKHWVLGIAMALAIAYFMSVAAAEHENPELLL